ncbi:hypothetical protein V8E36_009021 [Tilletia maclaganii]
MLGRARHHRDRYTLLSSGEPSRHSKCLRAYTIYTDTTFAFGSVTGQLFNLDIRLAVPRILGLLHRRACHLNAGLKHARLDLPGPPTVGSTSPCAGGPWLAYSLNLFVAVWACIGISEARQGRLQALLGTSTS